MLYKDLVLPLEFKTKIKHLNTISLQLSFFLQNCVELLRKKKMFCIDHRPRGFQQITVTSICFCAIQFIENFWQHLLL